MDAFTAVATIIGAIVGTLIGVHLGRRYYGLVDRWEGWAAEIEFIKKIMGL